MKKLFFYINFINSRSRFFLFIVAVAILVTGNGLLWTSCLYCLTSVNCVGVGAAILVTTVLGCCGISRESWLLVLLYASACGLLILLEVFWISLGCFYFCF